MVGTSGLRVTRMGLGTSTWGLGTELPEATTILTDFLTAGGTLIDVSPTYATGAAEQMLGELLRTHTPRPDLVISSSAGVYPHLPIGRRVDCSRRSLIAQLDATLASLGTEYLDLWSGRGSSRHSCTVLSS